MVIFLDGDNVTWTSYTPIDHVQWQISNQGLHGSALYCCPYTTHTHTCTHCHVSPRVNLFTCTSVHWSVWKPKLHIFPLASDPCGLAFFFSSIFHILCGWNHVATQLFIFFSFIQSILLVSFYFLFVPRHSYELYCSVSCPHILC